MICSYSVLAAGGFRAGSSEGYRSEQSGPLSWSDSQSVSWKTAIPGRGHSSPTVAGDVVYVTTTYEDQKGSRAQQIADRTLSLLLLAFGISGAGLAASDRRKWRGGVRPCLRLSVFVAVFVASSIVVLFGRHLLDMDKGLLRPLMISVVLGLLCLALGLLYMPLWTRRHLVAGVLSLVLAALAMVEYRQLTSGSGGWNKPVWVLVSAAVFLGLALVFGRLLGRRYTGGGGHNERSPQPVSGLLPFAAAVSTGVVVGIAPFLFLLFRAAGYRIPDSFVWHERVRPDAGWWLVMAYGLVLVATAAGFGLRIVQSQAARVPVRTIFFVAALGLASVYFVRMNCLSTAPGSIRAVVALDYHTGEILWKCEGLVGTEEGRGKTVTHASATPATDGDRVCGYFGQDGLFCADREGKLLWRRTDRLFRGNFGVGTSPVVNKGLVILVSDVRAAEESGSSIAAFDFATGEPVWQTERRSHPEYATYGTPLILALDNRDVCVVHGWYGISGYDIRTGRELWSWPVDHGGKHLVASMVADAERLYVSGTKEIVAFDLSKVATCEDSRAWSCAVPGEKSATPVIVDDMLFTVNETGTAFCLDARTGGVLWRERLGGRHFSSVVAMGDRILFTNESAHTVVVAAAPEFRRLAENRLEGSCYASAVPCGDRLFLRTTKYLYCLRANER
jgi:outer membrane protein assembly factor BamB